MVNWRESSSISTLTHVHTARMKKPLDQVLFEVMFQVQQSTLLSMRIPSPEDLNLGESMGRGLLLGQPRALDDCRVWQSRPYMEPLRLRFNYRSALYLLCDLREVSLLSFSCLICEMGDNSAYLVGLVLGPTWVIVQVKCWPRVDLRMCSVLTAVSSQK